MHQHFFEHRNDYTLPKNVAIVDGFEDIMNFEGRDGSRVRETCVLNNVDDYIRQLLFSALRPKCSIKREISSVLWDWKILMQSTDFNHVKSSIECTMNPSLKA